MQRQHVSRSVCRSVCGEVDRPEQVKLYSIEASGTAEPWGGEGGGGGGGSSQSSWCESSLPSQSTSAGVVPYLGTYLTVLTMLDTALPDTVEVNTALKGATGDTVSGQRSKTRVCSGQMTIHWFSMNKDGKKKKPRSEVEETATPVVM